MSILDRALRLGEGKQFKSYEKRVGRINQWEPELELLDDDELRGHADALRERARNGEPLDDLLPETFAVVRETSRRTMGMRHFDVQMIGGMVLHAGGDRRDEDRRGQDADRHARRRAQRARRRGRPRRHRQRLPRPPRRGVDEPALPRRSASPIGVLQNMQPYQEKRASYAADITYGTNSEFGFDYLRDNMATSLEEKVQHGGRIGPDGKPIGMHHFAIVDEVDNILIDEARTPLIISGAPEQAADYYVRFAKLAKSMTAGKRPEGLDPKTKKEFVADFDYEFEEKHKTVSVTERGVARAERFLGIDHLYKAENGPLVNHLIQSLKAESLYKKDVDYAVVDGEVKIIDEFTGRILDGRRWSEGLHQAVEAKEDVRVQEENQTLATVTLQNYFRMYKKLAGMTGTALTEANEFMKIYKLPVVQVPTNRPMVRKDQNDQVFKTKNGKWMPWSARSRSGTRPGSRSSWARSPSRSPSTSARSSRSAASRTPCSTPSRSSPSARARPWPRPAVPARSRSRRTWRAAAWTSSSAATRSTSRGLELAKLGLRPGDPDFDERYKDVFPSVEARVEDDREKVVDAGGLYIIGTERHESRRIDNQLRGRSGRQGDPGESRFFLSAEDDLVRLFAGDRIYRILDRLGPVGEDGTEEPIEAKMLSKQIEGAQRKVEEQNFLIRKRVLEYDDVMNQQREIVYQYRDRVLEGQDMGETARDQIAEVIERLVEEYTPGDYVEDWDLEALWGQLDPIFHVDFAVEDLDRDSLDREQLTNMLIEDALKLYDEREEELGDELMRALERFLLLQIIDRRWREHLYDMDYLREGIHLRGFAQIDPLVAYKNEGFALFQDLMNSIWADFARMVYNVQVEVEGQNGEAPLPDQQRAAGGAAALQYSGGTDEDQPSAYGGEGYGVEADEPHAAGGPTVVEQRRVDEHEQIGRNDPCWCGSGKKYKKCHGA